MSCGQAMRTNSYLIFPLHTKPFALFFPLDLEGLLPIFNYAIKEFLEFFYLLVLSSRAINLKCLVIITCEGYIISWLIVSLSGYRCWSRAGKVAVSP